MPQIRALLALPKGIQLCFGERDVRRLSIRPWIIGCLVYLVAFIAAFWIHGSLYALLAPAGGHWWSWIVSWLVWIGVSFLVLIGSMLLSVIAVLLFTSVFQNAIAISVLTRNGASLPDEQSGMGGLLRETHRTVLTETVKLFWILPLIIVGLIISFIPILLPLGIALTACLLAYQFVDIVLDCFRIRAGSRLRFALENLWHLLLFGLTLMAFWAIPFVGILLTPAAVAAAAWLLSEPSFLRRIEELRPAEGRVESIETAQQR